MSIGFLYLLFVKYGLLCFGGGYMLVPLFIHDLVETYHLLSYEQFGDLTAIAQMTPGPIGINTATYIGFLTHGVAGALIATAGLVTPGAVLGILAAYTFKKWEHSRIVQGLLGGMRPATLGLVISAILIFANLAIFREPLVVGKLAEGDSWPAVRLTALAVAVAAGVLAARKVSVVYIIFGAALAGALLIR